MNEGNCTDWKRKYSIWSTYRFIYGMIWKYGKKILAVGTGKILTNVGAQVMGVVIPAAVIAVLEKGGGMGQYLFSMLGLFLVSAAVYGAQSYFNGIEMLEVEFRAKHGSMMLMREACEADYEWMERKDTRENFEKGLGVMSEGGDSGMSGFLRQNTALAINILGLIIYMFAAASLEPLIILLLLAVSLIQMGIYSLARKYEESHKDERGSLWMKQRYHESVTDNIQAGKDIRLFGLRVWLLDYYEGYTRRIKRLFAKERGVYFAYGLSVLLMSALRDFVCYTYLLGRMSEGMGTAEFVFYLGIVAGFSDWFSRISGNLTILGGDCINIADFQRWYDNAQMTHVSGEKVHTGKKIRISFEDVSFVYPGSENRVLDHVSFTLSSDKKTALVGVNGAGKTTIVKLLCGLYRPTEGRILIDGVDLREINREQYFEKISAIFQEPLILESGLDENVACEIRENLDRARCEAAMKRSGLWEKIQRLPEGMESSYGNVIDKKGIFLSGGEQQKLLLARALYKDAPLILLDEPTAAMDALAEKATYEVYDRELAGKTVLFISHRLASTRFCDEILFLKNGTITERGTHEELLAADGEYAEMFEVQRRYYRDEKEETHEL